MCLRTKSNSKHNLLKFKFCRLKPPCFTITFWNRHKNGLSSVLHVQAQTAEPWRAAISGSWHKHPLPSHLCYIPTRLGTPWILWLQSLQAQRPQLRRSAQPSATPPKPNWCKQNRIWISARGGENPTSTKSSETVKTTEADVPLASATLQKACPAPLAKCHCPTKNCPHLD